MEPDAGLDGFFAEPQYWERQISSSHDEIFTLAREVNRECHSLIFNEADIRNKDGQGMLAAALFLRVLQHFQAGMLLLSKGMVASGKVAIRAELEAVFALGAVTADEANFRAFVNDDLRERLDLIKKAQKYDYAILKPLRDAVTDEQFAQLSREAQNAGVANKVTTSLLSRQAGLHDLYVSVYSLLSRSVHSGVGAVDAYLIADSNGDVREIEYAPELDEVGDTLLTACDFLLLASDAICHQFEITNFGEIRKRLHAALSTAKRAP